MGDLDINAYVGVSNINGGGEMLEELRYLKEKIEELTLIVTDIKTTVNLNQSNINSVASNVSDLKTYVEKKIT